MGIRSDVALAIKNEAFLSLSPKSKQTIHDWFGKPSDRDHDEGAVLFQADSVKWYHECFQDLVELYSDLHQLPDCESYLLIKACDEYPADEEADTGEWHENPFGIYKSVSVSIERW